jgi:hypothetical protein
MAPSTSKRLRHFGLTARIVARKAGSRVDWRNSIGVECLRVNVTQGSSLLATLGFEAESLWDSSVRAGYKDECQVQRKAERRRRFLIPPDAPVET